MKLKLLALVALQPPIGLAIPAQAENLAHFNQLQNYNECIWCDLRGVNLAEANLSRAILSGSYLVESDLNAANLSAANLVAADLREVDLRKADLSNADLRSADLRGANLRGANLKGALLQGANLTDTIMPNGRVLYPADEESFSFQREIKKELEIFEDFLPLW